MGQKEGEPVEKETFVRVRELIPDIRVELPYAGTDNFMGQAVYDFSDAWLRRGTALRLAEAQRILREQGFGLKILDAFRPVAAQFVMWEVLPNSDFVADPTKGYSNHSRGSAVDVTLVTAEGSEVPMPCPFDEFSSRADRDYSQAPPQAAANALRLERAMEQAGFRPYFSEWWHFSDRDVYPVELEFSPKDHAPAK